MRLNAVLWLFVVNWSTSLLGQQSYFPSSTQGHPWLTEAKPSQPSVRSLSSYWTRRSPLDRVGLELGIVGLMGEEPDSQTLAVDQTSTVLLDASELQPDMQFGMRAALDVYQVSTVLGGTDLQFGFFGMNNLAASRTVEASQVSPIFFNTVPVTPQDSYNLDYSTDLFSGEANFRLRNSRRVRPIVGLRYFSMEDTYNTVRSASSALVGGFSETKNSLFGGQFGFEATVMRRRSIDWFASGKLGVMNNRVRGNARAADSSSNAVSKDFRDDIYSSLVDAQTGLHFHFVDGLSFKIAYQYLFASRIATGLDQNASVFLLSPGEQVRLNSQLWQGINLSTQFSF